MKFKNFVNENRDEIKAAYLSKKVDMKDLEQAFNNTKPGTV